MFWLIVTVINFIHVEAASLICYNSSDVYTVTPIRTPLALLSSPFFDIHRKTVVYTFGYMGKVNESATISIRNAYLDNADANFIVLDWEIEASAGDKGVLLSYPLSALPNALKIGKELGDAILELAAAGLDLNSLHLIGHSLGSPLMGRAGNRVIEKGKIVDRITGLDPAGILFSGWISITNTSIHVLKSTSAKFVVGIHTGSLVFGSTENIGAVDIRFNCDLIQQPGCERDKYTMPFESSNCSHQRVIYLYAEALRNPRAFPAIQASNCLDWKNNISDGNIVYMGEDIDTRARGQYYLRTNSEYPWGMGEKGMRP